MVSVSAESHNSHKIVRNKASNMQLQTDEAEEFSWFLLSASAVKIYLNWFTLACFVDVSFDLRSNRTRAVLLRFLTALGAFRILAP